MELESIRRTKGRVLICAGSDSGGGAGIQADVKTVTALGGYAMTAITALTAQNTEGVFDILEVPQDFIRQQAELVLTDIGADAIKIGMLHNAEVISTICAVIDLHAKHVPLVVDPVMVSKSGAQLLDPDALGVLRADMIMRATVLTPNIPEAEILIGMTIRDEDDMMRAGPMLQSMGPKAVLLKGGHLTGSQVTDLLISDEGMREFNRPRVSGRHTHGTGCTASSAIAAGLAQGLSMGAAVERALSYVEIAIQTAPGFGKGHGPLNHVHTLT